MIVGFFIPWELLEFSHSVEPYRFSTLVFLFYKGVTANYQMVFLSFILWLWQTTDLGLCSVSQITYHGYIKKSLSGQCWTQPPPPPQPPHTHSGISSVMHTGVRINHKKPKMKYQEPKKKEKRMVKHFYLSTCPKLLFEVVFVRNWCTVHLGLDCNDYSPQLLCSTDT